MKPPLLTELILLLLATGGFGLKEAIAEAQKQLANRIKL